MIIDIIALWLGRLVILSLGLSVIITCIWYCAGKISNSMIEVKSIAYALASNMECYKLNKSMISQIDLRIGREWYVKHNGKTYLWKCTDEK